MPPVLLTIGPLLLVAATGFLAARARVLTAEQVAGLGRFLITVALPAVLVASLARMPVADVLEGPFILGYFSVGAMLGLVTWTVARRLQGASSPEAATMTLGVLIPNNIIIGYPIAQQVMGEASLPFFVAVVLVENAFWLPLALLIFEAGSHGGHLSRDSLIKALRRVFSNPITLAVLVGLLLSLGEIALPVVITRALDLLGGSVAGMALFFVGASLALASAGDFSLKVAVSVALRLIGGPVVAMLVALTWPGFTPPMTIALVLFAANPCFSILPVIAAPYGTRGLGASIQVAGTALSALTLTLVLLWLV